MTVTIAETRDIATCLALRRVVFIDEQGVPESDKLDDLDPVAVHLLASDDGRAAGSARLLTSGDTGKIGRVCVLVPWPGTGLGTALIRAAVEHFAARGTGARVTLGAQMHAPGFNEKLGFTATGPEFIDAGIPHREMVLKLQPR